MLPLARPVARAVWGNTRLRIGLDMAPTLPRIDLGTAPCLRCRIQVVQRLRLYSTQPPSNNTETPSTPASSVSQTSAHELPSTTESRRGTANQQFSHIMDNLQSRVLTASQTLNDLTGYSAIESIKSENAELETGLADAHERVRAARLAYKTSNSRRANTQREVTTLLARKDTWSPMDLERFTELYRADHVLEGEVAGAQEALTESEAEEQRLSQTLNAGILKRYHEEQIWSDRIRRASTWGTWGLMGMNFLLFVVLQVFAEPWRRKRLVRGVVAEEKAVLEDVRGELAAVREALARRDEVVAPEQTLLASETVPLVDSVEAAAPAATWKEVLLEPARWKLAAEDLFSERRLDLRMRDASVLALEGAVTGAVVVSLVLMRR